MRKLLICVAAATTALAVSSPAAAQYYPAPYGYGGYGYGNGYGGYGYGNGYGGYGYGNGYGGYRGYGYPAYGMSSRVQGICSGQRGYALENRLRHEAQEGEIDPNAAARIHQEIDQLEDQQRDECAEGDWGSITSIANRYDRIDQWIETMAHGYQGWDR